MIRIDTIWKTNPPEKKTEMKKTEEKSPEPNIGLSSEEIRERIKNLIKDDGHISQQKMAEELELSLESVRYHMKKMKKDHTIYRDGPDKGGKWVVNSANE